MLIDRDRFLRAALLMSLGGAPLAGGCFVVDDSDGQGEQTSGGEQPPPPAVRAGTEQGGPVYVAAPAQEGYAPAQEAGYAPAYEGGYAPANEGYAPAYEGGAPVYE